MRVAIPRAATGGLIGADQIVTITGPRHGLETVILEVNSQVQALGSERWFNDWAYNPSSASPLIGLVPGLGPSGGPGSYGNSSAGLNLLMGVAQSMPQRVMGDSRGFAMSCVVPNRLVGGLI